jgi:hypothetical protein
MSSTDTTGGGGAPFNAGRRFPKEGSGAGRLVGSRGERGMVPGRHDADDGSRKGADTVRVISSPILRRVTARPRELTGRVLDRFGRRTAAGLIAGLAVLSAVAAGVGWGVAQADDDKLTGSKVPARYLPAIESAARSCPMLTPARVAGHLMAESGLATSAARTKSGGRGIAGLDDGDWKKWTPWPSAARSNTSANILALAHQVCDFSGQLRLAGVSGDPWQLSLAAFRSGLAPVVDAGEVPGSAADYVAEVTAYAAYYARQPAFGTVATTPAATPAPGKPVPDEYLAAVITAGSVCAQFDPAAVAAVLMASSDFNPNLNGLDGEKGIARFRPELWQRFGPADTSAWEPAAAIPALGSAICGLISELSWMDGDDYLLSLAGFRIGPEAVRQLAGKFDGPTEAFLAKVRSYTVYYRLDTRLVTGAKPAPAPTVTSAPTTGAPATTAPTSATTAPTKAPATGQPGPVTPATTTKPAPAATSTKPGRTNQPAVKADGSRTTYGPYFLHNRVTGMCVDIPGAGAGKHVGPIQQHNCIKSAADNQEFVFVPAVVDSAGYQNYWIRNIDDDYCLDPPGTGKVPMDTKLVENVCLNNDNQYFRLTPTVVGGAFQYYSLFNPVTGFCVDLPGFATAPATASLQLATCRAKDDQDWALIQKTEW